MSSNNDDKFGLLLEGQLKVVENVAEINQTLKFQAKQLEQHIKRTELLETRLTPIEDHVKFIQKLMKLVAWAGSSTGVFAAVMKALGKL